MTGVEQLVGRINTFLINPLILLLFSAALVVFLWGVAQFLFNVNGGDDEREAGKRHMLWGTIGMFLMFSALAILQVLADTFGFALQG